MNFRMKDLENFAATAVCSTMGEAARRLGVSQPALSESIQRLEGDLRASVFYRSRSGIELTPRGRLFLGKVKSLLHSAQELEFLEKDRVVFGGQSISIGCHVTVASYSLPPMFAILKNAAPDFQIELRHDLSRNIQFEVQRGRLDVGIVINPVQVPDLVISRLERDVVAVWESSDTNLKERIIYNPNLVQSQAILKKWKNRPLKVIETESLDLICRLVAKGLGYGIIPSRAVELSGEDIRQVKQLPIFKDEIALVYRPEFGRSSAERLLIEAIKSAFKI